MCRAPFSWLCCGSEKLLGKQFECYSILNPISAVCKAVDVNGEVLQAALTLLGSEHLCNRTEQAGERDVFVLCAFV